MNSHTKDTITIEGRELPEYTILPYRGRLKDLAPGGEMPDNAYINVINLDASTRKLLPVYADSNEKRIYMEEKNFNAHWKKIMEAIFQEKRLLAFKGKAPMPSYSDIADQVDLSLYEDERRSAVIQNHQIKIIGKPPSEESRILQSKRASAMDNKKIRYVYSTTNQFVHDKACPLVKNIADKDFRASEELPRERTLCLLCNKMMYIRKGCGDDFKNYDRYQKFFQRGRVEVEEIGKLVNEYQAVIHMEDLDTMWIKCGEDQWKLCLTPNGRVTLLHNNYTIINDTERYISGGFHNQNLLPESPVTGVLHYIEGYTWEGHLAAQTARQAQNQLSQETELTIEPCIKTAKRQRMTARLLKFLIRVKACFSSGGKHHND